MFLRMATAHVLGSGQSKQHLRLLRRKKQSMMRETYANGLLRALVTPGTRCARRSSTIPRSDALTTRRSLQPRPASRQQVTAKKKGSKKPRRVQDRRVEKSVHVDVKKVRLPEGRERVVPLFTRGGAIGIAELSDIGEPSFIELKRIKTHRTQDKSGLYRWYNDYLLPESAGVVTVRLHGNDEDAARTCNRTENVRVVPPSDPHFRSTLCAQEHCGVDQAGDRRLDVVVTRPQRGSRSLTPNLIGYTLMVNSLAVLEHRQRAAPLAA
jgi:hypothetical protein